MKRSNKKEQIELIGKEFRQRFFGLFGGLIIICFSIWCLIMMANIDPISWLEEIGFAIIMCIIFVGVIIGMTLIGISLSDEGWS